MPLVMPTSQPLFKNIFILTKPRVADFADIFRIETMFMREIYAD